LNSEEYLKVSYRASAMAENDLITVQKRFSTDWCSISMEVNGLSGGEIEIRSRGHLEHLHFMLGQLLAK